MTTYDVIAELCKKNNLAITALERELGFGRGSIGKLRTGSTTLERLQKIADYFGVTVEYLSSGKEETEKETVLTTVSFFGTIAKWMQSISKELPLAVTER